MMFINKDLLEHSHACSFMYCLAAFMRHRQLRSPGRDCMVCNAENVYHLALYKNVCQPLTQPSLCHLEPENQKCRGRDCQSLTLGCQVSFFALVQWFPTRGHLAISEDIFGPHVCD